MADTTKQPSKSLKAVEVGLGIASAASLVMSFIPGVNLLGAAIQGGITVVQTGIDLKTKGAKEAAKTFAIGALLTGVSVIPFLGAAGKAAKAAAIGGDVAKGAKTAEAVGTAGKAANTTKKTGFFSKVGQNISHNVSKVPGGTQFIEGAQKAGAAIKTGAKKVGTTVYNKVPGVKAGHQAILNTEGKMTTAANKWIQGNKTASKTAIYLADHAKTAKAIEVGGVVGGVGLSMVGNTPPGNLARAETWPSSDSSQAPDDDMYAGQGNFANKVREERAAKQVQRRQPQVNGVS